MDYKGFQIQINPLLKLSEHEPLFSIGSSCNITATRIQES